MSDRLSKIRNLPVSAEQQAINDQRAKVAAARLAAAELLGLVEVDAYCPCCEWEGTYMLPKARAKVLNDADEWCVEECSECAGDNIS